MHEMKKRVKTRCQQWVNRYGVERAAILAMSAMPRKRKKSSLRETCLCGLMATPTTSFPRSSLLKGGTVPFQEI